jgi:glycosyltransferase involved in cell wall biosynthesis
MEEPELGRSLRALAPEVDWVILQLVRLAPHLEDVGSTPLMVDFIDSLALNFARRGELDRFWLRPLLRFEARRLEIWERRFAEVAQGSMVVCPRDRQEMLRNLPGEAGGRLRVVPVAVTPEERRTPSCPAEPPVVMVSGNLGYFPTVESAEWWARSVWPRLHRQRPEVRWRLAGARPPRRLRQIVESVGGEVVAGPKDLLGLLAQASVSLAPMRCGAGQPIKVMESWAVGVPVVASSWAAAGTTGRPGEDFLVADDPEEWVEAISRLLDEPETSQRLVANGKRRLRKDYGLAAVEGALLELLEGATG